jgi:hypothetical protein
MAQSGQNRLIDFGDLSKAQITCQKTGDRHFVGAIQDARAGAATRDRVESQPQARKTYQIRTLKIQTT